MLPKDGLWLVRLPIPDNRRGVESGRDGERGWGVRPAKRGNGGAMVPDILCKELAYLGLKKRNSCGVCGHDLLPIGRPTNGTHRGRE